MDAPTPILPSRVRWRDGGVRIRRAQRYRSLLLRDLKNNRLRKRYLDTRTAACLSADVCLANHRLAMVGAAIGILNVTAVGVLGSSLGAWLLMNPVRGTSAVSVALAVGMGSALAGALIFGALAIGGCVLF